MKIAVVTKKSMIDAPQRKRIVDGLKSSNNFDIIECEVNCVPDGVDCVLVFGGDGTMLDVARVVCEQNVAMLGINLGNLGFLAEFDSDVDIETLKNVLLNGKIVEKTLICTYVDDNFCAKGLNEVVIKSSTSRPIYLDLRIDGCLVDTYHSDGAIISTPTGSTAYSLSAGGPILAPDADAFVVLPICAHSLHSRPIVINTNSNIHLSLSGSEDALVCIDGNPIRKICSGENIFISRADKNAKFITSGENNFYKKLLQKMNRWSTINKA